MLLTGALTAYEIGQWTGRIAAVLLTAAGLLKCYSILRRPTANSKCILSLMCVLGTLLISSMSVTAGALVTSERAGALLKLINAGIAVCLLLAAIVLGIFGLTECQERRRGYKQGPAQAMWALAASGVLITIGIALGMGDFPSPSEWFHRSIPTGPPGTALVFEDFNFRFRTPGAPWTVVETNAPQSEAKLRFARSSPGMSLVVSAEKYGEGFSNQDLVEAGKARLRGALVSGELLGDTQLSLGGLSGIRVEMHGKAEGKDVLAVQWSAYTNGYGYHLVAQGLWRHQAQVMQEASNLFSLFECIDLNRVTDESGLRFKTNFVSNRYGYAVAVLESDWRRWQALQREFAWFDFAARREAGFYMAVVPVWIGQEVEEDALRGAMLATMGISYPDRALGNRKSVKAPGVTGVQFDYERYVYEVPYHYRLRILQGGGFAYLVCAWAERNRRDYDAALEEALGRVKFDGNAATAPEIDKLPYKEKATRALVLNQAGMYYYQAKNYARAQALFAAAYATEPQPVYFENTMMAWSFLNEPEKALEFVEKQSGTHPSSQKLQAYGAQFQGRAGKIEEAVAGYEKLLGDGYKDFEAFTEYVHLLVKLKRYDQAIAAVRREIASEDHLELWLLEAQIYRGKKDFAEAIRLLKAQREKAPFVPEVGHALAITYIEAGQFEAARALCLELLKTGEPSWETYTLKGRSEMRLEQYAEAKASLEQALRLSPGEEDTRKTLEQLSGMLGEGNNTAAKEVIPPVDLPAMLLAAPKAAPEGYGKEYGAYYSRRITAVEFDREGGRKQTDYGRVNILDSSGAAAFSSVEIPFDPLNQEIYVNSVRVLESNGNVITGKVSQFYISDEKDSELVSQKKKLNIPVSGIRPGSILEFMVTLRETGPLKEKPFLEFIFSRGVPVRQSIVYIAGETAGLKFKSSPVMEPVTLGPGRYWLCEDPIVIRPEPLHPPVDEFVPMMCVGDSSADWTDLGKKYFASIEDRLALNEALRAQVQQLTQDLKTEDEKVAVLARHVQTNYIYKGLEFGRRGLMPEKPEQMAQNKYGDCKDHSVMLQQMLEAARIPARLALVNTTAGVQKEMPSLDQFDHMIVYVPGRGTDAFIDCTQKGALLGKGPPYGLAKREAFIVEKDNPRFEQIPPCAAVVSSLASTRLVRLLDGGEVRVEEDANVSGMQGAVLREQLMEMPDTVRRTFFQAHLKDGQAELENWSIENLDNPAAPLQVKLVYKVRNQFHKVDARWLGVVPALLERFYLTYDQVDRRLTPFQLKYPVEFTSKVTMTGPEGWQPQPGVNPDQTIDEPFLAWHCHKEAKGSKLHIEFNCRQKPGTFRADQYGQFREAVSRALAMVGPSAAFEEKK
jgi:tetratricopeptide (TPR) repeat protein